MKRFLPSLCLLSTLMAAQAQVFYPTNLAVMTLGNNSQSLTTQGNTMNLLQYTPSGTLVSSTAIPDSGTNALICGGSSVTEGYLSLSADGRYLVWSGYNTNRGSITTTLQSTGANTNWRGIGTLDGYNNYTLQFAGNVESLTSPRGAVSDGQGNFWLNGGVTGIMYITGGAVQDTVYSTSSNERGLKIFNGNLFFSTGSPAGPGTGYWEINGLPTASGSATLVGSAIGHGGSDPIDFTVNTNLGIAYCCDYDTTAAGGGIIKFTYSGGVWTSNYTLSTGTLGSYAVVADWSHANPILYATVGAATPAAADTLVTITDTGAGATPTVIATASSSQTFRGLAWAPGSSPLVTTQPETLTNDYGQTGVFTVAVSGSAPLYYQWYSNSTANPTFVAITAATNATLSLPNLQAGQSNSMFYVVVTNAYGSVQSSTATLVVDPPGPPINVTVTPSTQTINAESAAVFSVSFAGATTGLAYGWTHNGTPLHDGALGASAISGSATTNLTIANAFAIDDGSYVALVTNSLGHGASAPAILEVNDPAILTGIMGETNAPGSGNYSMTVSAIGTGLTYQWLSNGIAISGANSSTYTVGSSSVSNSASYSVIVSNSTGSSVTNGPTVVAYTPVLLYDTFSYPTGNLFGDPGSPWVDINGTLPELVTNGRVQINENEATTDAQSKFAYPVSDGSVIWASFIFNMATLPPPGSAGDYCCNIEDTNFGFFGRIFPVTSNNPSLTPGMSPSAFPGTYRLAIAGAQNDSATNGTTGPTAVIPLDMAPGIDYEVVFFLNPGAPDAGVIVNPASYNDTQGYYPITGLFSGPTSDNFTPTLPFAAFGLRQRQNEGIIYMDNLEVSWDWNGAGSGYSVVTSAYTASNPVVGLQPKGTTNYSGNSYVMEVAASGIGTPGVGLKYAWYQNSLQLSDNSSYTGSATPALTLNSLAGGNTGTYYCLVTGAAGSTASSNAVVSVNTTPTAPSFTATGGVEPTASATVSEGGSLTLTANAVGTGPITYVWYLNNSQITSSSTSATLSLTEIAPSQAGTYTVVATGGVSPAATSSAAVVSVTAPQSVSIGYLRSLLTPGPAPTVSDTTTLFSITGTNLVSTNLTSGNTASFYIQDATGGINLFITGDSSFRPQLGDVLTATGTLSVYGDNFEIDVVAGEQFQVYQDLTSPSGSQTNLPKPIYFPWSDVASPFGIVASNLDFIQTNVEGSLVVMSNAYFATNGTFNSGADFYTIQDTNGNQFQVFVSFEDTNFYGQPIPTNACTITGPLYQDDDNFAIIVTAYSDIVTNPPVGGGGGPPVTITNLAGALSGASLTNFTLTWTAVPTTATYSVRYSTNAAGPYTNKLATGLTFGTTNGSYTTGLRTNVPASFFEVSSP